MTERTLAIVKPDAVERYLIGEIIKRYEQAGFKIMAMKMVKLTKIWFPTRGGKVISRRRTNSQYCA